jgi:hypothetical protein
MNLHDLEDHKNRLSGMVGNIAWRVARMPHEERTGYIWLGLQRGCEMYAHEHGDIESDDAEQLADHLQKWTEETVEMLLRGRDEGLWVALWGTAAAA